MLVLQILWTFSILSLVAIGGANSALPEMHRRLVVVHGWLDDATFSQLYALAQVAPGPNILVSSVMGWAIAGPAGMAAATVGMLLPAATLAWIVAGLTMRLRGARWLKPAQGGLVPIAVGLLLAAGVIMAEASTAQAGWPALAIVAVAGAFVWRTNYSPLWVLAGGGALGLLVL
ncbi:MAG: chromate transporter [Acetobacteraceae bacterium]|nr:chromate transporter [Acetobacteraceae bacterium]